MASGSRSRHERLSATPAEISQLLLRIGSLLAQCRILVSGGEEGFVPLLPPGDLRYKEKQLTTCRSSSEPWRHSQRQGNQCTDFWEANEMSVGLLG